ncbi:MAG: GC-type dockerin domain-anchored protein [Phycisphaerales bacterium]
MRIRTAITTIGVLASLASAGPEWTEGGQDAGNLPGNAQAAKGSGPLHHIGGELASSFFVRGLPADFQDMYLIGIDDPENFTATTLVGFGGFAQFDAELFLFFADGRGLLASLASQEEGRDPLILPFANDNTKASIPYKGRYLLAISGRPSSPRSQMGDSPIFNFQSFDEVSGPDGPGAPFPIDAWSGPGEQGQYLIALTGATLVPFGCNMADLAAPFGVLDFSDVVQFLIYFSNGDLIGADIALPFGVLDFTDIIFFLDLFATGCP